jgi:hypothetical protein
MQSFSCWLRLLSGTQGFPRPVVDRWHLGGHNGGIDESGLFSEWLHICYGLIDTGRWFVKIQVADEYYAGLWHRTLPQALLWSPYEEETFPNAPHKASLPSPFRAPSWSLASVESPTSNFLCRQTLERKSHARTLEITTTLQGPDPYGQVKAGSLKIQAPFQEVICGEASSRWPYQPNLFPVDYLPDASIFEEGSKLGHGIFDLEWPET